MQQAVLVKILLNPCPQILWLIQTEWRWKGWRRWIWLQNPSAFCLIWYHNWYSNITIRKKRYWIPLYNWALDDYPIFYYPTLSYATLVTKQQKPTSQKQEALFLSVINYMSCWESGIIGDWLCSMGAGFKSEHRAKPDNGFSSLGLLSSLGQMSISLGPISFYRKKWVVSNHSCCPYKPPSCWKMWLISHNSVLCFWL